MLATYSIAVSATIVALLGIVHLFYTFWGNKFHPRDADLLARLQAVSPVITRQTSMWKAWVGFNASHSLGAILFGAVYGYLALWHGPFLEQSTFLLTLGLLLLASYLALARLYWFSIPFRGILLALIFYVAGLVLMMK